MFTFRVMLRHRGNTVFTGMNVVLLKIVSYPFLSVPSMKKFFLAVVPDGVSYPTDHRGSLLLLSIRKVKSRCVDWLALDFYDFPPYSSHTYARITPQNRSRSLLHPFHLIVCT